MDKTQEKLLLSTWAKLPIVTRVNLFKEKWLGVCICDLSLATLAYFIRTDHILFHLLVTHILTSSVVGSQ